MLRIKLVKSPIGHHWRLRRTVAAIGLRKIHQVVEKEDNATIRGMIQGALPVLFVEEVETGKVITDARLIKRNALRRDKKPSETH